MMLQTCKVCDRRPATVLTIRRHVGMVVLQKSYKVHAPLCRDHGTQLAKEYLGKTLVQGWWGIISFFMNIGAVITDITALSKAKKLPAPVAAQPPPPPIPPTP